LLFLLKKREERREGRVKKKDDSGLNANTLPANSAGRVFG
jgi:hypothetical protein